MSKKEIIAGCIVADYLNSNGARHEESGASYVVVTLRCDAKYPFKPTNIALTRQQAQRLVKDLQRSLQSTI